MRQLIKCLLVAIGVRHPAKGVKVSPSRKAEVLLSYRTSTMAVFVETGTHQGGMIEALKPYFQDIYSIELDENLYLQAIRRFQDNQNIHLYQGDSAEVLPKVMERLTGPALFWLDAHGAGDITFQNSPIERELMAIFRQPVAGHIIIIDDARHFNRNDIRTIRRIAHSHNYRMTIAEGLFRLVPHTQHD